MTPPPNVKWYCHTCEWRRDGAEHRSLGHDALLRYKPHVTTTHLLMEQSERHRYAVETIRATAKREIEWRDRRIKELELRLAYTDILRNQDRSVIG